VGRSACAAWEKRYTLLLCLPFRPFVCTEEGVGVSPRADRRQGDRQVSEACPAQGQSSGYLSGTIRTIRTIRNVSQWKSSRIQSVFRCPPFCLSGRAFLSLGPSPSSRGTRPAASVLVLPSRAEMRLAIIISTPIRNQILPALRYANIFISNNFLAMLRPTSM
jgi:hypothetical protein